MRSQLGEMMASYMILARIIAIWGDGGVRKDKSTDFNSACDFLQSIVS